MKDEANDRVIVSWFYITFSDNFKIASYLRKQLALGFRLSSLLCCRDARVMRDLQTNKSKGYGFVSFINYQVS